jgi:hypothetical protein
LAGVALSAWQVHIYNMHSKVASVDFHCLKIAFLTNFCPLCIFSASSGFFAWGKSRCFRFFLALIELSICHLGCGQTQEGEVKVAVNAFHAFSSFSFFGRIFNLFLSCSV